MPSGCRQDYLTHRALQPQLSIRCPLHLKQYEHWPGKSLFIGFWLRSHQRKILVIVLQEEAGITIRPKVFAAQRKPFFELNLT